MGVATLMILLIGIGLRAGSAPAVSANECPRGDPGLEFSDIGLVWVAQRDGYAVPSATASPLNSPLLTPAEGMVIASNSNAVSAYLRPLLGMYLVTPSRYLYYPELGKCFVSVNILKHRALIHNDLLIDPATGTVNLVGDVERLRDAKRVPAPARLGEGLSTRIALLSPEERVPVFVWFKTEAGMDVGSRQERAFDDLVRTYPRAAGNLARNGKPFGPEEIAENLIIRQEYERLMKTGITNTAKTSATAQLTAAGVPVRDFSPMPAISAHLTKAQIIALLRNPGVGEIDLADNPASPSLLDAAESHVLGPVWNSGITGAGQMIAILENGNVQRSNSYLNFTPAYLVSPNGDTDHATEVAAAAASMYSLAPGSGRGASILSVGTSTAQDDSIWSLEWATSSPYNAKIVNYSMAVCSSGTMEPVSKGFDFWARQNNVLITASAGNDNNYVCSPANAYNVLGVGGFNNQNTGTWSDYTIYSFSSWRNPPSANSDWEKPELVAVGQNLSILGFNNTVTNGNQGTSLSAPEVAGLAGLMLNANPDLYYWPEASRAILIASATHNIEGVSWLTPSVDVKDGAGAIVGDQAVETAKTRGFAGTLCEKSCWWATSLASLSPGYSLWRSFTSRVGQRVRVAYSWWSTADPYPYTNDVLDTDLSIYISLPNGYYANATSISRDNNYEIVDFIAPYTGDYGIEIYKTSFSNPNAPQNYVGIAVVQPRYNAFVPIANR